MKTLEQLVRPNIWKLSPYSSARDEFHGSASVFLDANENPYNQPYNRYPDPMQWAVKDKISEIKKIDRTRICLGNGSDETIDLPIRAFCEPGIDNIVAINPSYGMYKVAADVNNVEFRKVSLRADFSMRADDLLAVTDENTKIIFLCSPNNPTGNTLVRDEVYKILYGFDGIVIIDEAYIDFSAEKSFLTELDKFPNLIVLQTLSKAWGAAGIRLGMAFASVDIIKLLNKIKYPYNINQLTQEKALEILNHESSMQEQLTLILSERARVECTLMEIPLVRTIYPTDANFILVDVSDANRVYDELVKNGVIVRNRNSISLCEGCLRITIGTPEENNILLEALKEIKL